MRKSTSVLSKRESNEKVCISMFFVSAFVRCGMVKSKTKNKIKEIIPFMNGSYDFSELYGGNTFKERSIKYTFELLEDSPLKLNILKTKVENWLLGCGQCQLYDDSIPDFWHGGMPFIFLCQHISCCCPGSRLFIGIS